MVVEVLGGARDQCHAKQAAYFTGRRCAWSILVPSPHDDPVTVPHAPDTTPRGAGAGITARLFDAVFGGASDVLKQACLSSKM